MNEWQRDEISVAFSSLILWVLIGTFALWIHNQVLPYLYLGFAGLTYFTHLYLACTRCPYFGKPCYIMGGFASPKFFEPRHQGPMDPDDSILQAIWFLVGVFPVPFLLYYQDWFLLVLYCATTYVWFLYKRALLKIKCKAGWCPCREIKDFKAQISKED